MIAGATYEAGNVTASLVIGDVFEALAEIPKGSVDLVLTSPPFLALRSYLPGDHSDKGREIGSEATPGEFLDTLLDVVEMCAVVLAPHGSLVFELGDTYAGSGGAGGDYAVGKLRDGQPFFDGSASRRRVQKDDGYPPYPERTKAGGIGGPGWPLDKSLCAIPSLFEVALAYGLNPLTGRRTDRWRVRNQVAWARPNPPVGALGDKFRPATSYMTVACKARDRWFDLDAVRGPSSPNTHARTAQGVESRKTTGKSANDERRGGNFSTLDTLHEIIGAPPLDYWVISTQPYPGAHYATWPESLCVKPILSMCPERVCRVCGEPSRRITEASEDYSELLGKSWADKAEARPKAAGTDRNSHSAQPAGSHISSADRRTLGWTDCGHDDWRSGIVLDPFAGSGTTLQVATRLGRDAIGIDLDERNEDLIRQRIGLFMGDVSYINKKGAASGGTQ